MNKREQKKMFSTCIEGMKITKKKGDLVTDCPFITIGKQVENEDICPVRITGSKKANSSFSVSLFHIGILYLNPSPNAFYSSIIPEYSLVGIYRCIKNKEYADGSICLLPQEYEEEYLKLVITEFGEWLYQQKMITKEERDS